MLLYPLVNQHNYGQSPFFYRGKLTISTAMFNSNMKLPEGRFEISGTLHDIRITHDVFLDLDGHDVICPMV